MTKKLIAIAGIILLVVVLGYLKSGMNSTAVNPDAPKPAPPPAAKPAPPKTAAPTPATAGKPSPFLPTDSEVGSPAAAKYVLVLGWQYDPQNQTNSAALTSAIEAVTNSAQESHGRIAAIIADVDVPVQDRSAAAAAVRTLGLTIIPQGQPGAKPIVIAGDPGEGALTVDQVLSAITANTK